MNKGSDESTRNSSLVRASEARITTKRRAPGTKENNIMAERIHDGLHKEPVLHSFAHYLENPHLLTIQSQWGKHTETLEASTFHETVFALRFIDSWLVGCTSHGRLLVWALPKDLQHDDDGEDGSYDPSPATSITVKGKPCLYDMECITTAQSKTMLLVSGDGGVYLFDWESQIQPHILQKSNSLQPTPMEPLQHLQLHPNPWERSQQTEINALCLSHDQKHVFGASGDSFGCYKWDMESSRLVATYPPKERCAYLHTVSLQDHTLLLGGEKSTLEMWDTRADKRVEALSLPSVPAHTTTTASTAQIPHWWTVAGQGYVASIHAATRSVLNPITVPETVHQIHATDTAVVSVGNKSVVSLWASRPVTTAERQHVACHAPQAYAVTVKDSFVAVGGVGTTVDVYYEHSVPYCQLSTCKVDRNVGDGDMME